MQGIVVAKRYAKALFGLIKSDQMESFEDDIKYLKEFFAKLIEIVHRLDSGVFDKQEKVEIIKKISSSLKNETIWTNFFGILVAKHRFFLIKLILDELKEMIFASQKQEHVNLVLARDHSKQMIEKIKKAIAKKIGKEPKMDIEIDKKIIGGFIANSKFFCIDCSVRNNLERLAHTRRAV